VADLVLRDVEEDVIEQLRERAWRNGRSFADELRLILRQAAEKGAAIGEMERIRRLWAGRYFSDSAELIREDRER
jgi:plasmid stability protein